ncbi:MAG: AMP-binding protein [Steroidobacteraceae bacterium]
MSAESMPNLYEVIQSSLREHARRPLMIAGERRFTGADIDARVAQYANGLIALGLQPDDRLAVQVEKSFENVLLYLASLRIGAVYLPLNTAYRPAEVAYFLSDATPRLFVCCPDSEAELRAVAQGAGVETVTSLGTSGDGMLPSVCAAQAETGNIAPRSSEDLAALCYTSGTTGRSKGAMITHGNLLSNAQTLVESWSFTAADTLLHALPLYHVHGLFVALHCALLSGARTLLHARFEAKSVLQALTQSTVMMGVPTFYTRLLTEAALTRDTVRNVRLFVSGSAPLLVDTFTTFEIRTGQRILERYGMTETGMITSNPLLGERRAGSVGAPLPHVEVRVCDEDGNELARGQVGNVEVRGPNVFKGYWQQPEKTRAAIRANGFFSTGDVGTIELDGYLRLSGRAKDLIISGGLNVYPTEIEEAIDAIDGVIESAVFGIPHPDFGEAVAAAVTLAPTATVTPAGIIETLRPRLAGFKTPKRVFVLDELPRNAMSKVQKTVLRECYKHEFSVAH